MGVFYRLYLLFYYRLNVLNRSQMIENAHKTIENGQERIVENSHGTVTFTLQKRKKQPVFLNYTKSQYLKLIMYYNRRSSDRMIFLPSELYPI